MISYLTAPRLETKARGELARGLRRSGFFKHRIPEDFRPSWERNLVSRRLLIWAQSVWA